MLTFSVLFFRICALPGFVVSVRALGAHGTDKSDTPDVLLLRTTSTLPGAYRLVQGSHVAGIDLDQRCQRWEPPAETEVAAVFFDQPVTQGGTPRPGLLVLIRSVVSYGRLPCPHIDI